MLKNTPNLLKFLQGVMHVVAMMWVHSKDRFIRSESECESEKKLKEQWGNINENISNIKEYFRFFAFALCEWTLRYDLTQNVP